MKILIQKLKTAWRSKEIAVLVNSIGAVVAASYGFDIQPIIETLEASWVAVENAAGALAALMAVLAATAAGENKEE